MKEPVRRTRYFTPEEAARIIGEAATQERFTVFTVGFATGLRVGELTRMTPMHWRWDQGFVEILDSKKKDPQLVRKVPFLESEGAAVRRFIEAEDISPDQLMFPKSHETYNRWIKQAAKKAQAYWDDKTHNCRFHSWRGTYVRYQKLEKNKGDKWIIQTTGDTLEVLLGYYEDLTIEDMVKIHRVGHR